MTYVRTQIRCYSCGFMGFMKGDLMDIINYCPKCSSVEFRLNPVCDDPSVLELLKRKHGRG